MKNTPTNTIGSIRSSTTRLTMPLLALLLFAGVSSGREDRQGDGQKHRQPPVPPSLQVPAGNQLKFRATGVGVQIYVWTLNATNPALASWVFKAPHAVLFHHEEKLAGIHYAGPTWQGNDGSKVVGARVAGVTVDASAIPWLLLQATSTAGDGVFDDITYIQRLNTLGGLAPTTAGSVAGEEALVPYIADYFFFHATP